MILLIVAIQGRILQQGIINNANTVTRVEVLKVLKESKVQVKVNATVDLWTNSTCVCPRLIRNRTYLLIGYEDAVTQRLLFLDNCLAAKWKKKWVKRLKVSYCPFRFCDCCYTVSDHNPEYVNRVYKLYWFVTSIFIPPPLFNVTSLTRIISQCYTCNHSITYPLCLEEVCTLYVLTVVWDEVDVISVGFVT